ncbi:MAG: NAD-binding protein [Aquificaceae bacterium]
MHRFKKLRAISRKLRIKKAQGKTLKEIYQSKLVTSLDPLKLPLLMLHTWLSFGTIGYMMLSDGNFIDSIYMTVITIGTIGFGEVVQGSQTPQGRIFSTFLAISGIGVFTTSVTVIIRTILVGDIPRLVKMLMVLSRIEKLERHVIVCGFNRSSLWLIKALTSRKVNTVLVDGRENSIKAAKEAEIELFIPEEPYKKIALKSAGIERASYLVSLFEEEEKNMAVIAIARLLRPNRSEFTIIATAPSEGSAHKLQELGANVVVVPDKLLANRIFSHVLHNTGAYISDLFDKIAYGEEAELGVVELNIEANSALINKKLKDLDFRRIYGVTIIGIKRLDGTLEISISGETQLEQGDTLLLLGRPKNLEKVLSLYQSITK